MRRDLARLIDEASELSRTNDERPTIDKLIGDMEIVARYLDPKRDADILAEAAKMIVHLRKAVETLPVATRFPPCPCGQRISLVCRSAQLAITVEGTDLTLETQLSVCAQCGLLRTFTNPKKLPQVFVEGETAAPIY